MFADTHLMDVTRLTTLGYQLSYIYLFIPFLYLFMLSPTACLFGPADDRLTSSKPLAPAGNSRPDTNLLLGILAGTFVLLQSTVPGMIYLSAHLLYSAFAHRPL